MHESTRNVAILGATGSIGQATLDVVDSLGQPWNTWAISAHTSAEKLGELADRYAPKFAALTGAPGNQALRVPGNTEMLHGADSLVELASSGEVDTVVAAIVGRAGLESTLAALDAGKRVALANKETLVIAGPLINKKLAAGGELLPIDSEHSAIFQCLATGHEGETKHKEVNKLILTSSGGPFRTWPLEKIENATTQEALNHPTWEMGPKITIDSATMMNKGLEVIEACWLFDIPPDRIEVVVHPQSIIHSMVEFTDGSILAQLSPPDMRLPIQYALTYPNRVPSIAPKLDLSKNWELTLQPADHERFPALSLAFEVARAGGSAGAVLNAANEQAVALFLEGQIRFTDIVLACRQVLDNHEHDCDPTLKQLLQLDGWARTEVQRWSCGTH